MPIISVTIDRTALSLPALAIARLPTDSTPLWLPEEGLIEPTWTYRTTYAPESAYFPGRRALAAVLDLSSLQMVVWASKGRGATLAQTKKVLEAAVSQWAYTITTNIDGDVATYQADPCWPQWGEADSGHRAEGIARATVNIPVNPATT